MTDRKRFVVKSGLAPLWPLYVKPGLAPLITWGFDVDTNGLQNHHQYTTNSGCSAIIIEPMTDYYTNNGTCPGVVIKAHYIGCCDGNLNWAQYYTEFQNGIQYGPTNDILPGDIPPYYYQPGSGYGKIGDNLSDYTDIADWLNGTCP